MLDRKTKLVYKVVALRKVQNHAKQREVKSSVITNWSNKQIWFAGGGASMLPCVGSSPKPCANVFVGRFNLSSLYSLDDKNIQRQVAFIEGPTGHGSLVRQQLKT